MNLLTDVEVKNELKLLFLEIREELSSRVPIKSTVKLEGKLLDKFNAFIGMNDRMNNYDISEMIGSTFWTEFYEKYPDTEEYYVLISSESGSVFVLEEKVKELNKYTETILLLLQKHIESLVDLAIRDRNEDYKLL